ncbi:MAG: prepilin-type N-terminal cleavage/methylation domain-containing protein [Lachnospiraceae bacterium]|nr:prepilin-type N-terminal cleavage/methylation domain-containing protein [Lachnospiraceae bacterium]
MKNNKGFSLVELIIVIAILAVVSSVSIVGLSYVSSTNVKSTVRKINSSLLKTQNYTMSKSSGGRDIGMRLTLDSSGNYCIQYIGMGQTDEVIGKSNIIIKCYKTDNSVQTVASGPVEIYFDRATGGLLTADASVPNVYWNKIEVLIGGKSKGYVTISKVTGKTEVTFTQ